MATQRRPTTDSPSLLVALVAVGCVSCGELLGVSDYRVSDPRETPEASTESITPCGSLQAHDPSGECVPVGIPMRGCEGFEGFVDDGQGGCQYLYDEPCTDERLLQAPGANCLGNCPSGPAPLFPAAVYVDQRFAGQSDGTPERPWTRIGDAVATVGATTLIRVIGVGVRDGDPIVYQENVDLPPGVSLSGWPCRQGVEIAGVDPETPTVTVRPDAERGGSVDGVSITGGSIGLLVEGNIVSGSDAGSPLSAAQVSGIRVYGVEGPGIVVANASVAFDQVHVVDVRGVGLLITGESSAPGSEPVVTFTDSRIERVTPESTDSPAGARSGWCIASLASPSGVGFEATSDAQVHPRLEIAASLLEECAERGVYATWGSLSVTGSVIRRVASAPGHALGHGISAEAGLGAGLEQRVTVTGTLIEQVGGIGVSLRNVRTAAIGRTTIRSIEGRSAVDGECREGGFGVLALADASDDADAGYRFPSDVTITESVIADSRLAGVQLQGVTATVDRTLIASTRADARGCPLAYGDGIAVYSNEYVRTDATVVASRIETAERAALTSFGSGGHVTVASAAFDCNDAFGIVRDVDAAAISLPSPQAVVCSCEGEGRLCRVERSDIQPSLVGAP